MSEQMSKWKDKRDWWRTLGEFVPESLSQMIIIDAFVAFNSIVRRSIDDYLFIYLFVYLFVCFSSIVGRLMWWAVIHLFYFIIYFYYYNYSCQFDRWETYLMILCTGTMAVMQVPCTHIQNTHTDKTHLHMHYSIFSHHINSWLITCALICWHTFIAIIVSTYVFTCLFIPGVCAQSWHGPAWGCLLPVN